MAICGAQGTDRRSRTGAAAQGRADRERVAARRTLCIAAEGGAGGRGEEVSSRFFSSLLPLWEKVAREARRMRGLYPRRETPHPSSLREATHSHKGRGEEGSRLAYPSSISSSIWCDRLMPPTVNTILAGSFLLPLGRPAATASRTAFSISRCEVMPTFFRNLRRLELKTSSFMKAPWCHGWS